MNKPMMNKITFFFHVPMHKKQQVYRALKNSMLNEIVVS